MEWKWGLLFPKILEYKDRYGLGIDRWCLYLAWISINTQIKDQSDISLHFIIFEWTTRNLQHPVILLLQKPHVQLQKVVNVCKPLLPIPTTIVLCPDPISNIIFSFTLMSNAIQARAFEPHYSCLSIKLNNHKNQVGEFWRRSCSKIHIGSQDCRFNTISEKDKNPQWYRKR